MKTCLINVGTMRAATNGSCSAFPVRIVIDGQESCDEILADEVLVHQKELVSDPGRFGGRDLSWKSDLSTAHAGSPANEHFAKWLRDLVFRNKLAGIWADLQANAAAGFRLVLDIEPPEIRRFRWEQIGADHFFPALHPRCAVVRGHYDPSERVALRDGPLRILVVIGSEKGDPRVLAEEETQALRERLDDRVEEVELHVLEQPGRAAFIEDYSRFKPHVLHFIGHGTIDPDDRQPYLVLYDGTVDRNWYWGLSDIIPDLRQHKPAFVFLNACHTADSTEDSWGISALRERRAAERRESTATVWSMSDVFLDHIGGAWRSRDAQRCQGRLGWTSGGDLV